MFTYEIFIIGILQSKQLGVSMVKLKFNQRNDPIVSMKYPWVNHAFVVNVLDASSLSNIQFTGRVEIMKNIILLENDDDVTLVQLVL